MLEALARFDPQTILLAVAAFGTLVALPFLIGAFRRLARLQLVRGTIFMLSGGLIVLFGIAAAMLAASLHTYARLTHEQEAARVTIRQLGERQFALTLETTQAAPRHFELRGDEWQIDARVLKWRGMGALLAFDTVYRLERVSGRYADTAQERAGPRTAYALATEPSLDFWALVRRYHDFMPLADALYGSAAYVPLAEGAEYRVSVSSSGLVVRPVNAAAKRAVTSWR
jgi:hypothetical protein